MSEPVVSVENLSKLYRIGRATRRADSLLAELGGLLTAPIRNFHLLRRLDTSRADDAGGDSEDLLWALRDVSFEVKRGEILGVVGRNGAGKSTLLKLLSRITEPTRGRIRIRGRVASLLEVGTGFHPELTGRQNVYLNGTVLGMSRREIDRKFDEIVAFSGVSKFLDTPVKRYSSGMKVRLGFAVAAHLEPDILIVDEVLAVGDAEFQRKCIGKMQDVTRAGERTILFVSHNMGAMRALCTTGVWLKEGRMMGQGSIDEVVDAYLASMLDAAAVALDERQDRGGNGDARIRSLCVAGPDGRPVNEVFSGDECAIVFEYRARRPLRRPAFLFTIYNSAGAALMHLTSHYGADLPEELPPQGEVRCYLPRLPLAPGPYHINAAISDSSGMLDHVAAAHRFDVAWADFYRLGTHYPIASNLALADCSWNFELQPS